MKFTKAWSGVLASAVLLSVPAIALALFLPLPWNGPGRDLSARGAPTQAVKTGYGPREAVTLLNDWQYTNRDIAEKHRAPSCATPETKSPEPEYGGYGGYSTKEHKSYGQTCGDDRDDGQRGGDRGGCAPQVTPSDSPWRTDAVVFSFGCRERCRKLACR